VCEACPDRIQKISRALSTISQLKTDKNYDENSLLETHPPIWGTVRWFSTLLSCPLQA
jgi:hypothetical protein